MAVGDLATWVSAIGTIFAVVVALWFSGRDGRRRRNEERRHQAERITAWIDRLAMTNPVVRSAMTIAVQNASDQLAYRVVVSLVRDPRGVRDPKQLTDDMPGNAVRSGREAYSGRRNPARDKTRNVARAGDRAAP